MVYEELVKKSKEDYQLNDDSICYLIKYYLKLDDSLIKTNTAISEKKVRTYFKKIEELKKGLPIQYVVGNVDFYGYNFNVKPGVLIPRFETEQLVYYTLEYIKKYFKKNISLIDVGTGSGVIGLSMKKEMPDLDVTMTDISTKALTIASYNANLLGVEVDIYKSDMLDDVIKRGIKFDILISNPPYIRDDEEIMDIVRDNEPSIALYGGEDGLKYYKILFEKARLVIKRKALIAFEIGAAQADDIIQLSRQYFKDSPYEVKKDLSGRDRMFFLFYNLND